MIFGLFGGDKKRAAELYAAASNGDLQGVRQALEKGADINALDPKFAETALHVAVEKSHTEVVELLLAKGANPDIVSNQHFTPLIIAAAMGDAALPMVELLIAGKANPSLAPTTGPNAGGAPLHIAASKGANAVLDRLLKAGAQPTVLPNGSTLMHMAAIGGDAETVEIVSKAGISVDTPDSQSRTPLHLTAITGNKAAAEGFLKQGAALESRDGEDCTPLMRAALNNQAAVVAVMLKSGANPDIVFTTGESVLSPLYAAAINGYDEVVKLLLDAGTPVAKKVGGLPSVVDMAQEAGHQATVALLKESIRLGKTAADAVKAEKKAGKLQSDLSAAIQALDGGEIRHLAGDKLFKHLPLDLQLLVQSILGDANQIKKLIAAGANPTTRFQELFEGLHPLYAAVSLSRDIATVEALLDGGADLELPCHDSGTALMLAVKEGQGDITQLLLARGAKGNVGDKSGLTALMLAARKGDQPLVDALLASGAEINATYPENGLGAFGFALDQQHTDLAKHLLDKGAKPDFGNVDTLPLAVVEHGDLALIQAIEARGGSIIRDDMKARVAFVAARNKDGEVLDYVLNHGADLNFDNDFNYTPLILASLSNHPELVKRYLERGDDANSRDVDQETALSLAIEKDHREVITLLRQHGAEEHDYPGLSDEKTMLAAATDGALGTILKLRDKGISINTEDAAGNTPLILAAKGGHLGVVRSLYHLGADINHRNHAGISATKQAQELDQQLILTTMKEFVAEDAFEGELKNLSGMIGGLFDIGDTMFGRMSHPYKEHPPYDNPSEDEEDDSAEENELDEEISEKLDQLEELLGRKNVAEKLTQEQMEALREKIESIRSGDTASNLAEEMEELEQLIELFGSIPEEDEVLPPIFAATAEGDIKAFRRLIKSGEDIYSILPDGTTLLITATEHGQENIVAELIKSEVDVNQVREDSFSALLIACFVGHEGIVQALLKGGADVNALYSIGTGHGEVVGCSALYIAAQRGHVNICQQLLKKGANIDAMNAIGYTPLMAAIKSGHEDVAILLLKAGANPDPEVVVTADIGGIVSLTPLTLAASNEITGIVGELLKRKVNVDKSSGDGWTALKYAAKEGNIEIVKMLLKAGASVDIADHDGWTPLMNAAGEGHAEVVTLLLKHGANPNCRTRNEDPAEADRTPLMDAAINGSDDIVKALLKAGADTNLISGSGCTALCDAVLRRHVSTTKLLLTAGADPNLYSGDSLPVIAAAALGSEELGLPPSPQIVSLLLKHKANPDVNISGVSLRSAVKKQGDKKIIDLLNPHLGEPETEDHDQISGEQLVDAVLSGDTELLKDLLEGGADPDGKYEGVTALFYACSAGAEEAISLLLSYKASPNVANQFGVSALHLAAMNRVGMEKQVQENITHYLIDAGANVNSRSAFGHFPYDSAVIYGYLELARFFVGEMNALSPQINHQDDTGRTVLLSAVLENDVQRVRDYLAQGVDVNRRDLDGQSALSLAVENGLDDIAVVLRAAGAESIDFSGLEPEQAMLKAAKYGGTGTILDLLEKCDSLEVTDDVGKTPIILAAENGQIPTISVLLHKGASINHRNDEGNSAYQVAEATNKKSVMRYLAKMGAEDADPDLIDDGLLEVDSLGSVTGEALMETAILGDTQRTMTLIAAGADVNYVDDDGRSILMSTVSMLVDGTMSRRYLRNIEQVVDLLLTHGASPNIGNVPPLVPPLMLAAAFGKLHLVNTMIRHGAELDKTLEDGSTALWVSLTRGEDATSANEECAVALINAGADLSAKYEDGATILSAAAESGFLPVVRAILERRSEDINSQDKNGITALMSAANAGRSKDVVEILLESGADPAIKDSNGETAADYANKNGHKEIAALMQAAP
ncbi:MAG: ankyrin repeat domain-containing protein [Sulfuricella sp.]|jgi:ankyrin repeat protein|nr:ankyrin repeat domain-containing protein [Sulfuricella sp.]